MIVWGRLWWGIRLLRGTWLSADGLLFIMRWRVVWILSRLCCTSCIISAVGHSISTFRSPWRLSTAHLWYNPISTYSHTNHSHSMTKFNHILWMNWRRLIRSTFVGRIRWMRSWLEWWREMLWGRRFISLCDGGMWGMWGGEVGRWLVCLLYYFFILFVLIVQFHKICINAFVV